MADDSLHNIKTREEYDSIIGEGGIVVLDAFATWCGPCKMIAPELVKMAKAMPAARFYKFDVDELPELAQELGISAMPTITVFKDGEKIDSFRGAVPPAIEAMVQRHLPA